MISDEGFRPERDPDFRDLGIGKQALQLAGGKQTQFLHRAFRNVRAQHEVVLHLNPSGQKLEKWQVMMGLKGIPEIRRGHKPALPYAHNLLSKFFLSACPQDVLNDGIGEHQVETLVWEGKRAAIE